MATTSLYPLSLKEELQRQFVGKSIKDVAGPAAVLDLSKLKNNCNRMLEAVDTLNIGWRAHIKTHKVCEAHSRDIDVSKASKSSKRTCVVDIYLNATQLTAFRQRSSRDCKLVMEQDLPI